jgi:transcriptional regulator with XRE-family HTH domain
MTIGERFLELRKNSGKTQEEVAERLGVTAQAVSKWENNVSNPDINMLPKIAALYNVSIDKMLANEPKTLVSVVPEEKRNIDNLMLKISVDSPKGERVRVNMPIALIKIGYSIGMNLPEIAGNDIIKNIDIPKILELIDSGVIGKVIDVENPDGTVVSISVESFWE